MVKIARLFTVDVNVYEAAKRQLPNMSEVVENALKDAVDKVDAIGGDSTPLTPFKGVPRRLLSKAAAMVAKEPINSEMRAERWCAIINNKSGTSISPQQLLTYVDQTEIIR